ncbi:S24 family peptidase [Fusobacterium hwasookii]|uniref:LexA repressor n=1 Tax=Fusobacterium hwasookii ChDC F206 TaxID=1307443 RepID=A0AAC8WJT4_9FUSO|nr:S24 family peptidase [Fusobacterium hwasookii]ALQ35528.1 LexA repressor [Fusobacterium hwasookii ChDC F206]
MKERDYELSEEKAIEIGIFLKNRREELGYSTNQMLMKTDIDKADLSRIESGKKRKLNPIYLKKLAKALKLDVIELFKMVGFLDNDIDIHTKKESFEIKNLMGKIVYFPVYGKASAGNGYLNLEQEIYKMPILDEDFPNDCFFVKIEGNSMEPTIVEGEFALVDPNDTTYQKNKIYVVTYDDESFIKRIVIDENTRIVILKSDNTDYDDILISEEKQEYLKINGRVIKIVSTRKPL